MKKKYLKALERFIGDDEIAIGMFVAIMTAAVMLAALLFVLFFF